MPRDYRVNPPRNFLNNCEKNTEGNLLPEKKNNEFVEGTAGRNYKEIPEEIHQKESQNNFRKKYRKKLKSIAQRITNKNDLPNELPTNFKGFLRKLPKMFINELTKAFSKEITEEVP